MKLHLTFLKAYLKLVVFFYYKRVAVFGLENIPKNKPVLLLGNHQNALLDPLLIAVSIKGFAHYLTRAAVFKKSFVAQLLKTFQLIPIYRIRDGYKTLKNNEAIIAKTVAILNNNETVVMFPEGSHCLERRVRPLSKGFTRIVFQLLEENPESDLQLIPVGFNYESPTDCPDKVSILFGKPIAAKHFISENKNEATLKLKEQVSSALQKLTTHIPTENYEQTLKKIEDLQVDFTKPESINACITSDFENCKPKKKPNATFKKLLQYLLKLVLLLPYAFWKLFFQPKVSEAEFNSTFRFVIAAVAVPIYLLLLGTVLCVYCGFQTALLTVLAILVFCLLVVKG